MPTTTPTARKRDCPQRCQDVYGQSTHRRKRQHLLRWSPHQSDPRADRFAFIVVDGSSIGSHYRNGTEDGERIKIVSMMNHPNYSENVDYSNDFMVAELERPCKFQPVKLAAADDSDFKPGELATTMGWGTTAEENGTAPLELQRVNVSDEACAAYANVDVSMVCAGGIANKDACTGDSGGPLIVENEKDGDVLVGIISWSKDDTCGREGYYSVYSRVD
ncbi:hypothetical protein DVH05_019672 [Phytophthora capsici]|nr:hypothetical protein DVH05_019672 [Phytophthora capsici]